jgi:hypothetical protein
MFAGKARRHDKVDSRLALIGLKEFYYIGMIQPRGN